LSLVSYCTGCLGRSLRSNSINGRTKFCQPGYHLLYGAAYGRRRDQDERFNRARAQEQEARGTGRHRAFGGMPPRRWSFWLAWLGDGASSERKGMSRVVPTTSAGPSGLLPPTSLVVCVCVCRGEKNLQGIARSIPREEIGAACFNAHAHILLGRTKFCQPGYGAAYGRRRDQDERFNRARAQEQEARGTGRHRAFGGMPRRWHLIGKK
jgi:hypothetical protein